MASNVGQQAELPRVAVTVDGGLVARLEMAHQLIRDTLPSEAAERAVDQLSLEKVIDLSLEGFLEGSVSSLLDSLPE